MTKKILYSVFALALLTSTVGCPPPAPPANTNVDISTDAPAVIDDNMTGTSETPSDNMTGAAEVPSDNMTSGSETP